MSLFGLTLSDWLNAALTHLERLDHTALLQKQLTTPRSWVSLITNRATVTVSLSRSLTAEH